MMESILKTKNSITRANYHLNKVMSTSASLMSVMTKEVADK